MSEFKYILPEQFFGDHTADCGVYFYESTQSSSKNKVVFNQNMLCILLEGQKEVINGSQKISLENEGIFLLQSGNTLMTERVPGNNSYRSILLFFSDAFLLDFMSRNKVFNIEPGSEQGIILFQNDDYTFNFQNSILLLKEFVSSNPTLVKSKLEEILSYLLIREPETVSKFIQSAIKRNKNIPFRHIVESQAGSNLTTEELSFLCNMSVSTFKRKFSEVFRISPKQYFITQRMNRAAILLKQNKRPSEIYYELGYEYLSAFSNEFKKHFGVSPKQFVPSGKKELQQY